MTTQYYLPLHNHVLTQQMDICTIDDIENLSYKESDPVTELETKILMENGFSGWIRLFINLQVTRDLNWKKNLER